MSFKLFRKTITYMFLTISLTACQGGGTSSNLGDQKAGNTNGGAYLPYIGSVHLVDPDMPERSFSVSQNPARSIAVLNETHMEKNLKATVYPRKEAFWIAAPENEMGSIYKVNLRKTNISHIPQKVSNIEDACELSDKNELVDENGESFLGMVIITAGQNKRCGDDDDRHVYITSLMGEKDEPVPISSDIVATSGRLVGDKIVIDKLLMDGGRTLCDAKNLTICEKVTGWDNNSKGAYYAIGPLENGVKGTFLCSNGALYLYRDGHVTPQNTECKGIKAKSDNEAIYAIAKDDDGKYKAMKLQFGTSKWQIISPALPLKYWYGEIIMMKDYIAISDENDENFFVIPKAGGGYKAYKGDPTFLLSFNNKLFYKQNSNLCQLDMEDVNSTKCEENATLIGLRFYNNFISDNEAPWKYLHKIIKSKKENDRVKLISVDLETNQETLLGTLPEEYYAVGISDLYSDDQLILGISRNNSEIFYVNLSQPNSLYQVTDTPNVFEKTWHP